MFFWFSRFQLFLYKSTSRFSVQIFLSDYSHFYHDEQAMRFAWISIWINNSLLHKNYRKCCDKYFIFLYSSSSFRHSEKGFTLSMLQLTHSRGSLQGTILISDVSHLRISLYLLTQDYFIKSCCHPKAHHCKAEGSQFMALL